MRKYITAALAVLLSGFAFFAVAADLKKNGEVRHVPVSVNAPFEMPSVNELYFPDRDFVITNYGAVPGNVEATTKAIAKAISECNAAGGGRVVVPAGRWTTGPVHLKSFVNLHLADSAVVEFTDNPADYLPAVMTSWEGMECYNYSPLVMLSTATTLP